MLTTKKLRTAIPVNLTKGFVGFHPYINTLYVLFWVSNKERLKEKDFNDY